MSSCTVYGCTNSSIENSPCTEFYPFPKNLQVAQRWIEACCWETNAINLETARICSTHFDETAYQSEIKIVDFEARYIKTLKSDAIPTINLPQTQIIIKNNPLELETVESIVVYTINTNSNDGITAISLENDNGETQIFEIQPSVTSDVKVEPQKEICEESEAYNDVKSYPDFYVLQARNKSLKRKVELLEQEVQALENMVTEKESEYEKYESEHKKMQAEITNKKMLSQQDQKGLLSKVFSEAQIKILFGKKKIYWTHDDMAVGYTIRHLSNKRCYAYLTKNLNIPLPGVSSVKRWVTAKKTKRIRS